VRCAYKDFAPTELFLAVAQYSNTPSLHYPAFSKTIRGALHPDDLVATIDIDHLAGDRGGSITR
jgi:hypothetical protein